MEQAVRTHIAHEDIDLGRAQQQHDAYRQVLATCGAEVRLIDANRELADCVFIEDTAVVLDEVAILTSMGAPSRQSEPAGIATELAKYRSLKRISLPATLEGGDVPEYGAEVFHGDDVVGTVTSPTDSPRFGVIGLAVLRSDVAENGTQLEVAVGEGRVKATVADLSIHDPGKTKPRS